MERCEQYEVWIQIAGKWEMIAFFSDCELASAMVRGRSSRMRLIHATYEEGKLIAQDVLADMGSTRDDHP